MTLPPWLQPVLERLAALHDDATLAHAILIQGPTGWGQQALGRALAARLLAVPEVNKLAHPDFRHTEPDGDVIKVDQIRALNDFARGTRQSAPAKVALIEGAERMNENAANALLKTLEEPPPATYLVLVRVSSSPLPITIVSRCQRVAVPVADEAQIQSWLQASGLESDRAHLLELGGAPYAIADAVAAGEPSLSDALERQDFAALARLATEMDPDRFVCRWLRCLRGRLAAASPPGGYAALYDFIDELLWLRRQLAVTGTNAPLLIERALMNWRRLTGSQAG